MTTPRDILGSIVKAYDVRGLSPSPLDPVVAFALGAAYAQEVGISEGRGRAVVGRDMRETSSRIASAVIDGVTSTGGDVVDIGLASTDLLYFASGEWNVPGVMVTASHNPAGYNGLKLCRAGARPIGTDSGLSAIADAAVAALDHEAATLPAGPSAGVRVGRVVRAEVRGDYVDRLMRLVPVPESARARPLRVVVDAGNAMAAYIVPAVFDRRRVDLVPLYFELDGRFPNHDPNPLDPANLVDLRAAVVREGADLGLAFDGDADRCFVVDERGEVVTPSAITALIASGYLAEQPGATILHNVICSRAVREIIVERGGVPVRTPVGHSFIKAEMARTGAVFGGEHSGHYYFSEFFRADSGMLAALRVMTMLDETVEPLSQLAAEYARYVPSGEINRLVGDADTIVASVRHRYQREPGVTLDTLDGLTVEHPVWWFNLRTSQTEPLLRLNVEADDEHTMKRVRDEVLDLVDREVPCES